MMKRSGIILAISLYLTATAQNNAAREEYERFRKEARKEYDDFRKKANEQYAQWMLKAWKGYMAGPVIEKPKDESKPPVTRPDDDTTPIEEREMPVVVVEPTPPPTPQPPKPIAPIREKPVKQPQYKDFKIYGTACSVRFNDSQKITLTSVTPENLSAAWLKMSTDDYNNTIRDCLEIRVKLKLSDWAYLQLLNQFAETVYGKNSNEQRLLAAYLYNQSGYKIRLGRNERAVYMLWASPHHLFDYAPWVIDNQLYYAYDCPEQQLQIMDSPYPGEQVMSLWVNTDQRFDLSRSDTREISSRKYPSVKVSLSVNKNLIDFYDSYPTSIVDNNFLTRWAMYAQTPLDPDVKEQLYPALKAQIDGLGQKEAANRLIDWVQTGFIYELDDKVWGHDRAFFAEESLYYPYCDCEDRSILFSRLVCDLLGLDVALVYYPGHLATAVAFTEQVTGDYITIDRRRFTIADPTYINVPVGITMPGMDNTTAQAILLQP